MARGSQAGVTMLELLIALFLLAVAVLGLAAAFPYAMYGVTAGGYNTSATLYAQQWVDRAQNTRWDGLCAMTPSDAPAAGFTRNLTFDPACSGGTPGTPGGGTATQATVAVTVTYTGPAPGVDYTLTLRTIVTDF